MRGRTVAPDWRLSSPFPGYACHFLVDRSWANNNAVFDAPTSALRNMVRACEFCRRRKIRCDASKPACSTCRNSNRLCVYHNRPPKQRPSAALIDSLQSEKTALEDALRRLKSADDAERRALLDSVIVRNGRISLSDRSSVSTAASPHGRSAYQTEHGMEQQLLGGHDARTREDGGDAVDGEDNDHDDDGVQHETDTALSLISKSHATSDGIFSSTSVVHVGSPITNPERPPALTESLRYQLIASAAMERQREHRLRRLTFIRGIPADLVLHLLDLHWSRQHHTFLLTYRPAFMRELEHGGPYCSDLLLYAVLACASKFSERPEVRSNPIDSETAGRRFFARCHELLLVEGLMTQSSIPTVIAMVMLGSTLIARGLTSKGWLYTGYAMRMVYDLGLYFESQEPHRHNVEEIEIRRRVFWGAFVCEKLQSLYLGRPPTIRLQDIHVSLDFLDTFEELEPWEPYNEPSTDTIMNHAASSPAPLAYSVTTFQQLCLLSQIMTQIIDKIYYVGATAAKTIHEIEALDDALTAWYRKLPVHLVYEPWTKDPLEPPVRVVPNRIIILTTYHSLTVLLHRPFITAPSSTGDRNSVDTIGTPAFSWKRCTAAARHITRLALSYQSIYPLRKSSYLLSYAVYVACTVHVLNTASLSGESDSNAHAESSFLLSASLKCLDALAVPNSGVADTARIIRKLMAAKGVQESPSQCLYYLFIAVNQIPTDGMLFTLARPEVQSSVSHRNTDNDWQFPNDSPTYYDIEQMQPFQDTFIHGQDLLFGFMNENMSLPAFDMNDTVV
ncbi:nitrogen assimilation transcription factor nirA [Aspergillus bombycis]|uniref:Nitrogen assimilation transcription factor nirA n=1 Tax=Aspergillus bombycis TaxID=109264 RepID=A0A1F8AF29_9EURO|nr:nitrogen assimilation transcription factor nirA [Aspergillus bombycis]OGM49928.1 nitrogen assimilation transcription factor nirA [Aspergillus bombycis]